MIAMMSASILLMLLTAYIPTMLEKVAACLVAAGEKRPPEHLPLLF